ncbi:MAG: glycosyltransferase family 2 protein [Gemmatimonadota bacterium]
MKPAPAPGGAGRDLSVVVPVGPGDAAWQSLVPAVRKLLPECEIVLSVCERTAQVPAGVLVVSGPAGRAAQLNRGASIAAGQWLWFLHADSTLGPGAGAALFGFLAGAGDRIGHFRLGFAPDGPWATRLNATCANLRSRWLGIPFGDQGLIVSRRVWEAVGPYDEGFGRGEDLELVVRARARGIRTVELGATLTTSARRYREQGWLRTTLRHGWWTVQQIRRARRGREGSVVDRSDE